MKKELFFMVLLTGASFISCGMMDKIRGALGLHDAELVEAAGKGNIPAMQKALDNWADIDAYSSPMQDNFALYSAAENGQLDAVKYLIEHGAHVNTSTHYGETPLHAAARNGNADIINYLLDHGAQINKTTSWKMTPLHIAASKGQTAAVQTLVNRGANVNAKELTRGETPADMAKNPEIRDLLEKARRR